jgi:hypothetical protein
MTFKKEEKMGKRLLTIWIVLVLILTAAPAFAAYHHAGEKDADKFLAVYPEKEGTKLDHCALCHSGGQYEKKPGYWVNLGSCQWCHYSYGYDGSGGQTALEGTINSYGRAYLENNRNSDAVRAIELLDSDGDGYANKDEIGAGTFPGDDSDDPSLVAAPFRVYTMAQLKALGEHTQFLLMNTSRSGDFYAEYTGVPVEDLLEDAGILDSATGITVYAPDGWSNYHPLEVDADPELYHVNGTYPSAGYEYDPEADSSLGGWCDYSAPSCQGRSHGDAIAVSGGLKMILAYSREGVDLDTGVLNEENKLDGEGPFRVVPPQKAPNPPDQSSNSDDQNVIWPYTYDWDHNAGAASRSATIIRAEPLPSGTTDINILEAGWAYVDQKKIIVYGAIDGTDSNGNGVSDSEEGADPDKDFDGDGIADYQDSDTTHVRHAEGLENVGLHTSNGDFVDVEALCDDDPAVIQTGKPSLDFPYGTIKFEIVGLTAGESVTLTLDFPDNVPTNAQYYKIDPSSGWYEIPFDSNDGDSQIMLTLTDGDPETDADGLENGTIVDPGALALTSGAGAGSTSSSGSGGGGCFVQTAGEGFGVVNFYVGIFVVIGLALLCSGHRKSEIR